MTGLNPTPADEPTGDATSDRDHVAVTPEQIAACGAAIRAAWAKEALSLPHAVLIVDEDDPEGPYHLFGPYDTRSDAVAVAADYLETVAEDDDPDDLEVRVVKLTPIGRRAPPDPPAPRQRPTTCRCRR